MCLLCVEFQKAKMTREEVLKALPEMIMFAKTEKEKEHFEKLKKLEGDELLQEVLKNQNALVTRGFV